MIRNIVICIFSCAAIPLATLASGIFTLKGTFKAVTEDSYAIETRQHVYRIRKLALSPLQQDELKKTRTGARVEIVVSTASISEVSDRLLEAKAKDKTGSKP